MPTTPAPWSLPYPAPSDLADVPSDMEALGLQLNTRLDALLAMNQEAGAYNGSGTGTILPTAVTPITGDSGIITIPDSIAELSWVMHINFEGYCASNSIQQVICYVQYAVDTGSGFSSYESMMGPGATTWGAHVKFNGAGTAGQRIPSSRVMATTQDYTGDSFGPGDYKFRLVGYRIDVGTAYEVRAYLSRFVVRPGRVVAWA